MTTSLKPIFLLADSQVLFTADHARPVATAIAEASGVANPSSAYVGAANGDDPAFFSIFESAMELVGSRERRMIRADFPSDDRQFLESADIIVLAGGDPARGWTALERGGVVQLIRDRYCRGAVLIGVSAGAAMLGEKIVVDDASTEDRDALRLVPWIVDAHDEANDWSRLRRAVDATGIHGLGLSSGGGAMCHADMTLEPLRRPTVQFLPGDGDARQWLVPEDPRVASATEKA